MKQTHGSWTALVLLLVLVASPLAASAQGKPGKGEDRLRALEKLQIANSMFGQRDYETARKYYTEILPFFPNNLDILKNLALCHFRLRSYADAARYYQQVYELNPSSREIPDFLARSLMSLKKYDEAAALLRRMAELPGAAPEMWQRTAEAYESAGRMDEAVLAYDAYLQRSPGDLKARTSLGKLYAGQKDYPKAVEQFRLVLSANPNFSPAMIGLARVVAWQGQHEEALGLYERALKMEPRNGEALSGKSFVLLWSGRYQEAYNLLKDLRRRYPTDGDIARAFDEAEAKLNQQGLEAARRTGEAVRLEDHYRERITRNPNDGAALKALAGMTGSGERCAESVQFGQRALALSPDDLSLELILSRSLALCERYDESFAHFQRYAQIQQQAEGTITEIGRLLLRARRYQESATVFRNVIRFNPQSREANVGLARSLAALGDYSEALRRYELVLESSPYHYDALQGKAFVLYYMKDYSDARPLFEQLQQLKPEDGQNADALKSIARAEEAARWTALRPPSGAPPEDYIAYYQKRLAAYPEDPEAAKGLAYNQGRLRNYGEAIPGYRKVLAANPADLSAKKELARLLALDKQYDESIQLYQEVVQAAPDDTGAQESLARNYVWAGRHSEALPIYQSLTEKYPEQVDYRMEVARMQLRTGDYAGARASLNAVAASDPQNREARVALAQLDLREGQRQESLRRYNEILAQNPDDTDALYGKAQILYYNGDLGEAYKTASHLVDLKPDGFDAVYLLANIENARRRRTPTLALLDRAAQLSPDNPDVRALTERIRQQPVVTLRTSSTYGREISDDEPEFTRLGEPDLRFQTHRATVGWSMLPKTDSFLSFGYSPVGSPTGGLAGKMEASDILYTQRTRLTRNLTLRLGVGAVRFGGDDFLQLPGYDGSLVAAGTQPVPTADMDVQALGGVSYRFNNHFSLDLDFRRSPITYTHVSTGLGVMENEWSGGLNFDFDPKTSLRFDYGYSLYTEVGPGADRPASIPSQCRTVADPDRHCTDHANVFRVVFNRNVYGSDRLAVDLGYTTSYQDFAGPKRDIFLGFFNPDSYQVHQATGRFWASLLPRLDFELRGAYGLRQQSELGVNGPIRPGESVSPSFVIRVHRRLTVTLRYSYYSTSQTFGDLSGNVFSVVTDWKF